MKPVTHLGRRVPVTHGHARWHHQGVSTETALTPRVRQGLGLLVVAVILWLVLMMLARVEIMLWGNDWKYLLLGTPLLVCLFGGLGLLAYGLLRRR